MAFILPVNGVSPVMGQNCFVAPNATIVGNVVCGDDCSYGFNGKENDNETGTQVMG